MKIKVLVCGGREYGGDVFGSLDAWRAGLLDGCEVTHVIHGNAPGADAKAGDWASFRGIQEVRVPANWVLHGRSAGPIRNKAMLALAPDLVVAFPGGSGTASMKKLARAAGIAVKEIP